MDKEGTTLATELLAEIKASARRWFIAFLVMLCIEIVTIASFIWYISLPIDEVAIENDDGNAVYIGDENTMIGGVHQNGENNTQAQSSEETSEKITE